MTILPLDKRYHPDFQNPRVKPVGNVELDLSHPAAINAVYTCLADDKAGHDLALGAMPTAFSAGIGTNLSGRRWEFSTSSTRIAYPQNELYNTTGDLSLIISCSAAGTNDGLLLSLEEGTGETQAENTLCFLATNPSSVNGSFRYIHEFASGQNELHDIASFFTNNVRFVLIIVRDDTAKTVKFYKDSVLISTFNYTNSPNNTGGVADINIGERSDTTLDLVGDIDLMHITTSIWSEATVKELSNNIYSFLKPVDDVVYFPSEAVAAAGSLLLMQRSFRQ